MDGDHLHCNRFALAGKGREGRKVARAVSAPRLVHPLPLNDCVRTYARAGCAGVPSGQQTGLPFTPNALVGGDDRVTVLEFDLVDVPGTAGSAAA